MTNVEKDIAKARKKPMAEDKMKELLLKLRKGATGTLTFVKFVNVLDVLGWKIEPVIGWVPMHYPAGENGKKKLPVQIGRYRFPNVDVFHAEYQKLKDAEVSKLPEPSKVGERVIMNVTEPKGSEADHTLHFSHDLWVSTEGVVVQNATGETSEPIFHSRHDVENTVSFALQPNRLVHEIWRWATKHGLTEAVSEALDMEVHVPAAQRTRANTGTCPACWGNYKLDKGRLVMHGYERPGYGHIKGSCFCVDYQPVETSDKGLRAWRDQVLLPNLRDMTAALEAAKGGKVDAVAVSRRSNQMVKRGEPHFEMYLTDMIRSLERDVESLQHEVDSYNKYIAAWKVRPMPKDGELQRGPGFFLKP